MASVLELLSNLFNYCENKIEIATIKMLENRTLIFFSTFQYNSVFWDGNVL